MTDVGYKVKKIAVILFVLSAIGSFILGCELATGYSDFNFYIFLVGVISSFISCMLIYVVGEIADLLQSISDDVKSVSYKLEKQKIGDSKGNIAVSSKVSGIGSNEWKCSCGAVNAMYVSTCSCGKSRSNNY